MNEPDIGYGGVAKMFHWLIFFLLVAQYAVGSIMPHIGRDTLDEGYVAWHLSIGAAILFVIVPRLLWRIAFPVPLDSAMPRWERLQASVTHWMLYALVLLMTLLGWAAASARGWQVNLFGIVPLPALATKGARWGHEAGDIHTVVVYVLLAFIVLHLAGALFHYFVKGDSVIQRMLPNFGS